MNNPFAYTPSPSCETAFQSMLLRLEALKKSDKAEDKALWRELEMGKMLGVLIALDESGRKQELFAFSGQIGNMGFGHSDFVEPVFDYLQPQGYFKKKEREVSETTLNIALFENEVLAAAREEYSKEKGRLEAEIEAMKVDMHRSKLERDAKRAMGVSEAEAAAMIAQSQFEKAELRRLKKRLAENLAPLGDALKRVESEWEEMKGSRRAESEMLQKWLFDNTRLLNARGEEKSLGEIFESTPFRVPPSGAGECCAPKLLQAAYLRGWHPVEIAEYWYGRAKGGEVRRHGRFYPACRGKCLPVLSWMLQGLDIEPPLDKPFAVVPSEHPRVVYENEWFCVVDKPPGMLSVPGKDAATSVEQWLKNKYGPEKRVKLAHRLDQDTSGLLIAAFGEESYRVLQSLFLHREVKKTYIADLEGDFRKKGVSDKGRISLPLIPDWLDRPRQRVDWVLGKEAVTEYKFVGVSDGRSRVVFHPLTGRTHQLRVHAASSQGLGLPIVGDRLYGIGKNENGTRLHLHAHRVEFKFPLDGKSYKFESTVRF